MLAINAVHALNECVKDRPRPGMSAAIDGVRSAQTLTEALARLQGIGDPGLHFKRLSASVQSSGYIANFESIGSQSLQSLGEHVVPGKLGKARSLR